MPSLRRVLFQCLFLFPLLPFVAAAAQSWPVHNAQVLVDSLQNLSIHDLQPDRHQATFAPVVVLVNSTTRDVRHAYWIRFHLRNVAAGTPVALRTYFFFNKADLYVPEGPGRLRHFRAGLHYPFRERVYKLKVTIAWDSKKTATAPGTAEVCGSTARVGSNDVSNGVVL